MAEEVLHETNGCSNLKVVGFPKGDYRIISWDLDLTGRRLIDEICQITAFFPGEGGKFSQYVMPYRKPNPASQRRHHIKVVTVGRYRMLKHAITGKFLHSKSEISALSDFIAWLEKSRGKDGVILMSYEPHKVFSHILLESLVKFNLMEAFCSVVKGFANGFDLVQKKLTTSVSSYSLHAVARTLLGKDRDMEIVTSLDRNRAAVEVIKQVCESDAVPDSNQGGGDNMKTTYKDISAVVQEFSHTVEDEKTSLNDLKELLQRQSTFRPIFGPMIQKNRRDRQRASVQRQLIAESGLDYPTLFAVFQADGPEGIAKTISEKLTSTNTNIREELVRLLIDHFDPPTNTDVPALDQNINLHEKSPKARKEKAKSDSNGASTSAESSNNPAPSDSESHSTGSQSAKSNSGGKTPEGGKKKKQKNPGKTQRASEKKKKAVNVVASESSPEH